MKTKTCSKCGMIKSAEEFNKCKTRKDGLHFWCKDCRKKYRDSHKQQKKEYDRIHQKEIKSTRKEYNRTHKKENKERQEEYERTHKKERKQYSFSHKDKKKEYNDSHKKEQKIYREKNKIKIKQYKKEYCQLHKKERNKRDKQRRKTDINFKIRCYLSIRIHQALKRNLKSKTTMQLLGCAIKELRTHLQKQFLPGMTWKNHGLYGWHIDHIKPCALFDLSKPSEQRKCFHYTNLQPLWAIDNLIKGDKYTEPKIINRNKP